MYIYTYIGCLHVVINYCFTAPYQEMGSLLHVKQVLYIYLSIQRSYHEGQLCIQHHVDLTSEGQPNETQIVHTFTNSSLITMRHYWKRSLKKTKSNNLSVPKYAYCFPKASTMSIYEWPSPTTDSCLVSLPPGVLSAWVRTLRAGEAGEAADVPRALHEQGVRQTVAPAWARCSRVSRPNMTQFNYSFELCNIDSMFTLNLGDTINA